MNGSRPLLDYASTFRPRWSKRQPPDAVNSKERNNVDTINHLTRAELDTMLKDASRKVWRMNMASQRMKNPSFATARRQSDFYKSLIKTFGESDGKSMWIAYVRSLKDAQAEVRKANKGARLWLRYLKAVDRLMKHQGL